MVVADACRCQIRKSRRVQRYYRCLADEFSIDLGREPGRLRRRAFIRKSCQLCIDSRAAEVAGVSIAAAEEAEEVDRVRCPEPSAERGLCVRRSIDSREVPGKVGNVVEPGVIPQLSQQRNEVDAFRVEV